MGNENSSCLNQATPYHLDQLYGLVLQSFEASARLPFDPFQFTCRSTQMGLTLENHQEVIIENFDVPEPMMEEACPQTAPVLLETVDKSSGVMGKSCTQLEMIQQKNQVLDKKSSKTKLIKRGQRVQINHQVAQCSQQKSEPCETVEHSTGAEDMIRDQNNCKSYHKLVKNYLLEKELTHLFDEHGVEYHTRYYFIVALIFIKYYLKQDFNEAYQGIVSRQIDAQNRKIERQKIKKDKIDRQIKNISENSKSYKELLQKKHALDIKIQHINVVIHEIQNYSLRSCKAFFGGQTEQSLRILYLKDDPVMRKKYYFDSALQCVLKIESEVKKATSQTL